MKFRPGTVPVLNVSRFANSVYLRLKLAKELEKRQIASHVFETCQQADRARRPGVSDQG
jgi:hypothetical protein